MYNVSHPLIHLGYEVFNKPTSSELRNAARQWPHNHVIAAGTEFIMAFPNAHLNLTDTSYTENLTLIVNNPSTTLTANITVSSIFPDFITIQVSVGPKLASIVCVIDRNETIHYML